MTYKSNYHHRHHCYHYRKYSELELEELHSQTDKVFRTCGFYLVCRKRMREQEIADEEAAKKKKEWEKEWEVRNLREPLDISLELVPGAFSLGGVVKTKA